MPFDDQEQRVRSWVEKGKHVGKSLSVDRGDRSILVSVTLRKDYRYEALIEEHDLTQIWAGVTPERRDERTFATIDEAAAFIASSTPMSLALLAPATAREDAVNARVPPEPRQPSSAHKTSYPSKEEHVRSWIEQGKQVGKAFTINTGGRRLWGNVAIEKQQGTYRAGVDEFDEALDFDNACVRDDRRTFGTLDEAVEFIESTAPVKLAELAPRKGRRWL